MVSCPVDDVSSTLLHSCAHDLYLVLFPFCSVITATTGFVKSPSGKLSGTAILSAAAAVGEGAKALSQAWSAASQAYNSIDPDKVTSTSVLSVDRIASGIKNAIYSKQVKEALNGVGSNLSISATEAVKVIPCIFPSNSLITTSISFVLLTLLSVCCRPSI